MCPEEWGVSFHERCRERKERSPLPGGTQGSWVVMVPSSPKLPTSAYFLPFLPFQKDQIEKEAISRVENLWDGICKSCY